MLKATRLGTVFASGALLAASTYSQVPDLLNAYQAADRAMGMGGALDATDSNTLATYYNPAGLGFLDLSEFDLGYSNLPKSVTSITNTRTDPHFDSQGEAGSLRFTNVGFATPLHDLIKGGKGTIGISYNVGGYINDSGFGPSSGLPDGPLTLNSYRLNRSLQSDFYTLAYGISNAKENLSFGAGITYVSEQVGYTESASAVDSSGNSATFSGSDINYTANGVGAIVGLQYIPPSLPSTSWGLSYRTPIHLNNAGPGGIYDDVPGRLLFGGSYRKDSMGGGDDYLLFGGQVQYFFSGSNTIAFDQGTQTSLGMGVEYNHSFSSWRLPLRVGYETLSSGGVGFGSRNVFTYGFGYRPSQGNYGIDLSWASPEGGGRDFGVSASYRFK